VPENMLANILLPYVEKHKIRRIFVAVSGGIDSVVLLDCVMRLPELLVSAIHVNHHLHPLADEHELFCLALSKRYQIEVHCESVEVSSRGSMEARAREARYEVFSRYLSAGDVLLLAHHSDDQVETLLLKLFRGGRVFGLEGMPGSRALGEGLLFRPFLGVSRADIKKYAIKHELLWCEDPSNLAVGADRNYIRHEVVPLIYSRFPSAKDVLIAGLGRDMTARSQLAASLGEILEEVRYTSDSLNLERLQIMSQDVLVMILTRWLEELFLPQPTGKMLLELANRIVTRNRIDMSSNFLEFREFKGVMYVLRPIPEWGFVSRSLVDFEVPGGAVYSEPMLGCGLKTLANCKVAFRTGGEKIRIGRNRAIKNLFQENRVPFWIRNRVPLIYVGDEIVAIAAIPGWMVQMQVADGWGVEEEEKGFLISLSLEDRVDANY
jgi:tRNA(Ile)-lysidine synthase